jgi:hypothetical protein
MMQGEDIHIITVQYYVFNLLNCSEKTGVVGERNFTLQSTGNPSNGY